jgi:hypothetical protein
MTARGTGVRHIDGSEIGRTPPICRAAGGRVPASPRTADEVGMRRTSVALVVLTAGLTASAAVRRVLARRRAAGSPAAARTVAAPAAASLPPTSVEEPAPADDAVVLPFARRAATAPVAASSRGASRCGDTGGLTKAGAPCAARATGNGRCHHHRVAA